MSWSQYAYVSGLGKDFLAEDFEPVDETQFETPSEQEERLGAQAGHHCGWKEFCTDYGKDV